VASASHFARSTGEGKKRPYLVKVSMGEPCPSCAWITATGVPARAARTAQWSRAQCRGYEPITRGPLRLDRRWSYEAPELPVRTVEEETVRLLETAVRINERARMKASRPPFDAE
jgi:hypothetical protein